MIRKQRVIFHDSRYFSRGDLPDELLSFDDIGIRADTMRWDDVCW